MTGPGWERAEVDDVEVVSPVDVYHLEGEDTYIVYDEDGEQYCFPYEDE